MWMQDQRSSEATEEEPSVAYAFRHVYRFILRAMQGDTDAASALFQRYLAGELPEELLALSRRCVQQDQTPNRATPGSSRVARKFGHRPVTLALWLRALIVLVHPHGRESLTTPGVAASREGGGR